VTPAILVLNAGSSSLKFGLYAAADLAPLRRGALEEGKQAAGTQLARSQAAILDALLVELDGLAGDVQVVAAGHRVVHGGERHATPAVVTPELLTELEGYAPLAPQHQPYNLAGIRALARRWPRLPQVACFDTAFHRTQPRYGFHGLSYEYIAGQLSALGIAADARVVVAHLGHGASLCALHGGQSIATTMGFSTLDGLMMGQRCGALDAGVVLHLLRSGLEGPALERLLNDESGLLGVSGVSDDVRVLEASADPAAREALDLFAYRVARELGSLVAALGGLDALVFTAGIGEHSAPMRARIAALSGWCGVELDAAANGRHARRISTAGSRVGVYVLPTDEEIVIARAARSALVAAAPAIAR
jgi:acetate kinase